ncbi:unnamed protein product [Arabis nemorensis]|uniref:DUF4216 domain-containing protein n=1 Tax=Arabis nemorensis TaxID=586526 RepID=A0A565BHP7_9BRAS|nr:unnamed protein product [Arabis nemorensis]
MLTTQERYHLQYYVLTNLDEISEYERIYEAQVRFHYPHFTEEEITMQKKPEFVDWMHYYVTTLTKECQAFPTWLQELVHGPLSVATPYKMYFTRGYGFKIYQEGTTRTTCNYGISSASDDLVYYGVLREILEIQYPGMLGMKYVVFYCDWYNPIEGYGVRHSQFGVTLVHFERRLQKYDPFVLASQPDQVCYIRYPHVTTSTFSWFTVTLIYPRGRIDGVSDHDPMQQNELDVLGSVPSSLEVDIVVDFTSFGNSVVFDDSEDEPNEFEEELDFAGSSDYSSDSE